MMKINIKGPIIPSSYRDVYQWLGMEATSPIDITEALEKADGKDVEVEINSGGGSVFAGSEIYTALKSYKGQVMVRIVGIAASAASVIAMAGDLVAMSPTAQIMIHNSSASAEGDYRDMDHTSSMLKNVNKTIASAYRLKTKLKEEDLLSLMDNETWMTSKQAKEMNFIDEIMFEDEFDAVASIGSSNVLPKEIVNKIRNILVEDKPKEPVIDQEKEREIENQLKELDLILELSR